MNFAQSSLRSVYYVRLPGRNNQAAFHPQFLSSTAAETGPSAACPVIGVKTGQAAIRLNNAQISSHEQSSHLAAQISRPELGSALTQKKARTGQAQR